MAKRVGGEWVGKPPAAKKKSTSKKGSRSKVKKDSEPDGEE